MATSGFGTTIAGATTTDVGEVISIGFPSASADVIDTTYMASASGWREKCAGLKDGGDLTVTARYAESTSEPLYASLGLANETWTITLPGASTIVFSGFISGISGSTPHDDKVEWEFTLTVSGAVTFTVV